MRKIFEEVTTKNVKTILEYSKTTRKNTIEIEQKVLKLEETIRNQNATIERLAMQLANIQTIVYKGGT